MLIEVTKTTSIKKAHILQCVVVGSLNKQHRPTVFNHHRILSTWMDWELMRWELVRELVVFVVERTTLGDHMRFMAWLPRADFNTWPEGRCSEVKCFVPKPHLEAPCRYHLWTCGPNVDHIYRLRARGWTDNNSTKLD